MANVTTRKGQTVQDAPIIHWLLNDKRAGWIWFLLRIWLGWQWVTASSHKLTSPAWMVTGDALKGFWLNSLKIADPAHPTIAFGWYRAFLQAMVNAHAYTWFAKFVAVGELLVGIGLILGAFTGIAAFFGGLMNWNFMMAGSASTNPMLFLIEVGLILAWKVSGYIGADYVLLPRLGTPWGTKKEEPQRESGQVPVPSPKPAPGD
jgi:thiosulfate dehydrogenase [quinone] large subunit